MYDVELWNVSDLLLCTGSSSCKRFCGGP